MFSSPQYPSTADVSHHEQQQQQHERHQQQHVHHQQHEHQQQPERYFSEQGDRNKLWNNSELKKEVSCDGDGSSSAGSNSHENTSANINDNRFTNSFSDSSRSAPGSLKEINGSVLSRSEERNNVSLRDSNGSINVNSLTSIHSSIPNSLIGSINSSIPNSLVGSSSSSHSLAGGSINYMAQSKRGKLLPDDMFAGCSDQSRFTDLKGDYAKVQCVLCAFTGTYARFRNHTQAAHAVSFKDYKTSFGPLKYKDRVLHKCRECGETVQYIQEYFCSHLRSHGLSRREYERKHFTSQDEAPERFSDGRGDYSTLKCSLCPFTGFYGALRNHVLTSHKLKFKEYKMQCGAFVFQERVLHKCRECDKTVLYTQEYFCAHLKSHALTIQKYFQKHFSLDDLSHPDLSNQTGGGRFSDAAGDYSTLQCSLCPFAGFYPALRTHIRGCHELEYRDYKASFGPPKFKDKVLHRCRECGESVLFIQEYLCAHLKTHSLTRQEYNAKHFNNSSPVDNNDNSRPLPPAAAASSAFIPQARSQTLGIFNAAAAAEAAAAAAAVATSAAAAAASVIRPNPEWLKVEPDIGIPPPSTESHREDPVDYSAYHQAYRLYSAAAYKQEPSVSH